MRMLWVWGVVLLAIAGCATTTTPSSTTGAGTTLPATTTTRSKLSPPAYFDFAVPTQARGTYRVYRFNRITQKVSLLRTEGATTTTTTTTGATFVPPALKDFVDVEVENPIQVKISGGSTISPTTSPPPPPDPTPGGTGELVWTPPRQELEACMSQVKQLEGGQLPGGKPLVGQVESP